MAERPSIPELPWEHLPPYIAVPLRWPTPDAPPASERFEAWSRKYGQRLLGALHDGLAVWLPDASGRLVLVHREGAATTSASLESGEVAVAAGSPLGEVLERVRRGGQAESLQGPHGGGRVVFRALPEGAVAAGWDLGARGSRTEEAGEFARGLDRSFQQLLQGLGEVEGAEPEDRERLKQQLAAIRRMQWRLRAMAGWDAPVVSKAQPLDRLLAQIIREIRERVPEGVDMLWAVPDGLPGVAADPTILRALLEELVENCLEAIGERGGRIQLGGGLMRLRSTRPWQGLPLQAGRYLWFEVVDDGPGVDTDRVPDAFKAGASGDPARGGLGLSAVRALAGSCGGGVRMRSVAGRGTLVQVALPMKRNNQAGFRLLRQGPESLALAKRLQEADMEVQLVKPEELPGTPASAVLPLLVVLEGSGGDQLAQVEEWLQADAALDIGLLGNLDQLETALDELGEAPGIFPIPFEPEDEFLEGLRVLGSQG